MKFQLSKTQSSVIGDIRLDGSKSISNRALMIRALTAKPFEIQNLSTSEDSQAMQRLIGKVDGTLDVGPAGTTFRFLTALYATKAGQQILTGSTRMKQRPIGPLVDALRGLGADIAYLEKEGYPPLRINTPENLGEVGEITVPANISSQFISALLMIAPTLPNGLKIFLQGKLVSASYLQMTLDMMAYFGISYRFSEQKIEVPPQQYASKTYRVESDWSAASYHFAAAALAQEANLTLRGLQKESMQGDAVAVSLFSKLGLQVDWLPDGLTITKSKSVKPLLEHDFIRCPDIAQTLAVVCGGLGVVGTFTGLETLSIKETDRIHALKVELAKIGVSFVKAPARFSPKTAKTFYMVEGKAHWSSPPEFSTYHDHRMAMAFAPLSVIAPVKIDDPSVVGKSYPDFWKDLTRLGWEIELVK
ncbi:MAG: 3-phosphoshikimate 1-carboxyvinyltransferase [Saprospiraceae bacterium]|nr:3-phosphoshikimate 1-carboxyvinyltransferase [Saprospiraceae bacterium]